MTARHFARETATLTRLRLSRNPMRRGTSPWEEAVIETSTTGASWPWNLSTVPSRTPPRLAIANASRMQMTCALYGDDQEVVLDQATRSCRVAKVGPLLAEQPPHLDDDRVALLGGEGLVASVRERDDTDPSPGQTGRAAADLRRAQAPR